jgi:type IV fimbrial biogenesis protein FimT
MNSGTSPTSEIAKGFSLIEILVALAIFAILLSLALPNFSEWIRNIRLRSQAEAVLGGLQLARAEAMRRNRFVRFQLVTAAADGTLDNTCAIAANGTNRWVVSHGDPSGQCDLVQSQVLPADNNIYSANPVLLIRGVQDGRQDGFATALALTTPAGAVIAPPAGEVGHPLCFEPGGKLTRYDTVSSLCTASANPGTTTQVRASIDVTSTTEACAPGGNARCLRITVASNGETRLCDPATAAPDVRVCPW